MNVTRAAGITRAGLHSACTEPVLVFRTSVQQGAQVEALAPLLDRLMDGMGEWNFDLGDREHILRVDAPSCTADQVRRVLLERGFHCEELE